MISPNNSWAFFPRPALLLLTVAGLSSCATPPTPIGNGGDDARRDISLGHIQLMEAGTIVVYTPGVKNDDRQFDNIPRHELPCGCTNPRAMDFVHYAEDYNAVMIAHISSEPNNAK
jgi:hypothetical protein